ncbi:hypothetical protein GWK47_040625 [Chionoecetes opilio]|uniref:Uncharacterized protein n=1 Tax=Chionoecetes opilio TaxID=41210 RepID=A0A8J5D0U3_CHIOP|nr:hypothetical protein GWK47_040625 [Chionoecetes opilio]
MSCAALAHKEAGQHPAVKPCDRWMLQTPQPNPSRRVPRLTGTPRETSRRLWCSGVPQGTGAGSTTPGCVTTASKSRHVDRENGAFQL